VFDLGTSHGIAHARKALRTKARPDTRAELTPMGPAAAPFVEVAEADAVEVPALVPLLVSLMVAEAVGEAELGYVLPKGLISKLAWARISVRFWGFENAMV